MNNIVMKRTRGNTTESIHRGHICVIDKDKKIISHLGDPLYYTFFRSAAKPVQAMSVILSGAYKKFDISKKELALMCASHYGENQHIETLFTTLSKIGFKESDLLCGKTTSYKYSIALEHARNNKEFSERYNDCSGKHAGMLAICKMLNLSTDDYLNEDHLLQKEIKRIIAYMSEYPENKISLGVDGCSVPVFAMPLYNMAVSYINLIKETLPDQNYSDATKTIVQAMTEYPEMIAGTDGFCTELIKAGKGRIIAKLGAEAVYCIAFKEPECALAFKIEDGNKEVLPPVIMETLIQLDLLRVEEYQALVGFHKPLIRNTSNKVTGQCLPDFKLI